MDSIINSPLRRQRKRAKITTVVADRQKQISRSGAVKINNLDLDLDRYPKILLAAGGPLNG